MMSHDVPWPVRLQVVLRKCRSDLAYLLEMDAYNAALILSTEFGVSVTDTTDPNIFFHKVCDRIEFEDEAFFKKRRGEKERRTGRR